MKQAKLTYVWLIFQVSSVLGGSLRNQNEDFAQYPSLEDSTAEAWESNSWIMKILKWIGICGAIFLVICALVYLALFLAGVTCVKCFQCCFKKKTRGAVIEQGPGQAQRQLPVQNPPQQQQQQAYPPPQAQVQIQGGYPGNPATLFDTNQMQMSANPYAGHSVGYAPPMPSRDQSSLYQQQPAFNTHAY